MAIDAKTRQVIAFHVGDRTRENAITMEEDDQKIPGGLQILLNNLIV